MTAVSQRFAVRVMVSDVWDQVVLPVEATSTIAQVKQRALEQVLRRSAVSPEDYVVKYRGGAVLDESVTVAALGVVPNAALIIIPARRRPVR